jgi:hypothetical protein
MMQLTKDSPSSINALDLSEIRTVVARYLDCQDCLSCMRVSRAWFQDFAPSVWHTIDFENDMTSFLSVSPQVLEKYGAFISKAINITDTDHLESLQHAKVNSLKTINVHLSSDCIYREMLSDLMLRCSRSFRTMDIRCDSPSPDTFEEQRKHSRHFLRIADMFARDLSSLPDNSMSPARAGGNCLRTLQLWNLCITREGFSTILRCSPSLDELTLYRTVILRYKASIPLYTGSNLRYLSASLNQIYAHDTKDPDAPCLLLHFPLLQEWNISWMNRPDHWTSDPISEAFSAWCPQLRNITFATQSTELISNLLINTFEKVEACTFSAKNLTTSTALGLVAHQETLTSLTITDTTKDKSLVQWFHMIPRMCSHLQVLTLESLVFDSELLDTFQWSCIGLRVLRVQFKDLDDAWDIDGCLKQLCDWRRFGGSSLVPFKNKKKVATNVCQYLFQFEELRTVWLGTKDYYLPPFIDYN